MRYFFHDLPYAEGGEAAKMLRTMNPDFLNDPVFPKDKAPLNDFASVSHRTTSRRYRRRSWNDYLTDRASVLALDPKRAAKPETLDEMRQKFGVQYKAFGVR